MTSPLIARTRPLDVDIDLLDVAGDDGIVWLHGDAGMAGRGEAMRIEVPRSDPSVAANAVSAALGSIEIDDEVGTRGSGPVAIGALPFAPDREGHVVVPTLLVAKAGDGTRWVTTVARAGEEPDVHASALLAPTVTGTPPSTYSITSERPVDDWCRSVESARDELRAGAADKVVLARAVEVVTDTKLSRRAVLDRLRTTYPSCMVYAVAGFAGASPELLVAREGDVVRSHPMAGTAARSDDPSLDARLANELLTSSKDLVEHRYTIDMVHDTLLPWCSWLDEEAEPSIVTMANVRHLATLVEGRLSSPPASVVELMTALHPTPAVCGSPRADALELIDRYEALDRGRYAGPVGWVDANGDGEWAVAIRSAELDGRRARLMAGVGVVADSDPMAELAETRAKLQALLGAIVRP